MSERYFELGFGAVTTQETPKKLPKKRQEEVLEIIKLNPQVTVSKLAELLNRSQDSARHHLRQLTANGIIKHEGSTKSGKWIICK